jgi:Flp pilus assembly protein TadG
MVKDMTSMPKRSILRNRKGQNLVEFALVVPMLVILMFGIAEFGRAWMTKNLLTGAAREAVRAVVVFPGNEAAATARGQALLAPAGITTATFTTPYPTTTEADGTVTRSATVNYTFTFLVWKIFPGLGSGSFPLSSTAKMRREYTP